MDVANNLRDRFYILYRDGFTCQYCGRAPPEAVLHIDHIYPKTAGDKPPEDSKENLITSCSKCNWGKYDTIIDKKRIPRYKYK